MVNPSDPRGSIFLDPTAYADQEHWHEVARDLRDHDPVLRIEAEGYTPFWAVTRYDDVFKVSRDNEHFLNTRNSILGLDAQFEFLNSIGIEPKTLIHMDGVEHAEHRGLANAWFRPRAVSQRQEAIEAIADEYVEKFRELGGQCDFAQDIAVPYTLRRHLLHDLAFNNPTPALYPAVALLAESANVYGFIKAVLTRKK